MRYLGLVLVMATACSSDKAPGLVIGAVIDQTGSNSETSWVAAVQLAVADMNSALAAEHYPLSFDLALADSQNDPDKAVTRASDLVLTNQASALITDTQQVTEAVAALMYASPPAFDVLVQCSSCTSANFLSPAATAADPVLLAVRQNQRSNLARTTLTTNPMAYVAVDSFRTATNAAGHLTADRNNDRIVKLCLYASNEASGQAATAALYAVATQMFQADYGVPNDPASKLRIERIFHDPTMDPAQVSYDQDIARLTDTTLEDEVANIKFGDAAGADYIVVSTFAHNAAYFREAVYDRGSTNVVPVLYYDAFRESNTLYQLGSVVAEGAQGLSMQVIHDNDAGAAFADNFQKVNGFPTHFGDAMYYDNAMTIMLASLIAGVGMPDPLQVTPAQISAALPKTSAESSGSSGGQAPLRVIPGAPSLQLAIAAIKVGTPINYDGASGPLDYDANRNVQQALTFYVAHDGQFADVGTPHDCVASPTTCGVTP